MKHEFSRQIFEKSSNTKFYKSPPSRNRVVACEQTDGRTDVTNLIVASRSFANVSRGRKELQNIKESGPVLASFTGPRNELKLLQMCIFVMSGPHIENSST
jgi:hypothetical protein